MDQMIEICWEIKKHQDIQDAKTLNKPNAYHMTQTRIDIQSGSRETYLNPAEKTIQENPIKFKHQPFLL